MAPASSLSTSPCNLCPRECGALRGAGGRGVCGASEGAGQVRIARAALHFWEEPPISGERGSGTVFFTHCPLQCAYCQNSAIARGQAGRAVGVDELAQVLLGLQEQGALNVNFVTPTHYTPAIAEAVAAARAAVPGLHVPVVWNTSGYESVRTVEALAGTVDVYLADFKYADARTAARYSHAPDYPQVALAALEAMARQVGPCAYDQVDGQPRLVRGVVVRHLLLPGLLEESARALALLFGRLGNAVRYSIMNQYTPVLSTMAQAGDAWAADVLERFPELAGRTTSAEYEQLLDFADELGMEDYFWQDGPAAEESFIPSWDF